MYMFRESPRKREGKSPKEGQARGKQGENTGKAMGKQAPKKGKPVLGGFKRPIICESGNMRNRPESTLYNIKKGKAGGKRNDLTQGAEEMTAKTQQRPAAARDRRSGF